MANLIRRMFGVARARTEGQVERLETPDVLAREAVRYIEAQLGDLHLQMHRAKTAEITARSQAAEARRKAEVFAARAQAMLEGGDSDGAVAAMRNARVHAWKAERLEAQRDDLHRLNEALSGHLEELSEQRTVVRMQAEVEMARWAGAKAAQVGAEARWGRPGKVGQGPYDMIEAAMRRSEQIAASAMATVELGQRRMDMPELSEAPDFTFEARQALGLAAPPAGAIGRGPGGEEGGGAGGEAAEG